MLDGFGVLQEIEPERLPVTVFVTAYDKYAIQAFEAHALDYLLKPFSDQRFEAALRRVCEFIRSRSPASWASGSPASSTNAPATDARSGYLERVVLKSSGRVTFLDVGDVDWIEASGRVREPARRTEDAPLSIERRPPAAAARPEAVRPRPPIGRGQYRARSGSCSREAMATTPSS